MAKRPPRKRSESAKRESDASQKGEKGSIVILFADIIGCSEISNHATLKDYNVILQAFQLIFMDITKKYEDKFYKSDDRTHFKRQVRGDEGCLMIFRADSESVRQDIWADDAADIDTAITAALDLKRGWLLSKYNKGRIESGRLACDIAIGIHFGKAWINDNSNGELQPEGYAINITKRIENYSREGAFTHIYISEAAYDRLYFLKNEMTYTFADPRLIKPKGFSQGINVFEVKHHFLPTDWMDEAAEASKWRTFNPTDDEKEIVKLAHQMNPTNLWLAEENIIMQMLTGEFKDAADLSRKLDSGPLHDAVSVCLLGFILGEEERYKEEQELYKQAIDEDKYYAEAYWYLAYSISREIYDKYGAIKSLSKKIVDISEEDRKRIESEVYDYYKKAIELKPRQVWMKYDYACELWRWGKEPEAVQWLVESLRDELSIREMISDEPYLRGIEKNPTIKQIMND